MRDDGRRAAARSGAVEQDEEELIELESDQLAKVARSRWRGRRLGPRARAGLWALRIVAWS